MLAGLGVHLGPGQTLQFRVQKGEELIRRFAISGAEAAIRLATVTEVCWGVTRRDILFLLRVTIR